jgi:hypothetical protein
VADPPPGGVEIDAVFSCEQLYFPILFKIFLSFVLDVVIESEYRLAWIGHLDRSNASEFRDDGAGVIVRHYIGGFDGKVVAGPDDMAIFKSNGVALRDLFN